MQALLLALAVLASHGEPRAPVLVHESTSVIRGTLDYIDEYGTLRTPRTGSVTIWRRAGLQWHLHEARVTNGFVNVEMPEAGEGVDIGRVIVDGRDAFVECDDWPRIGWVARLAAPVRVCAIDATTNRPLSSIEVREDKAYLPLVDPLVPPLDRDDGLLVAADSTTPLVLPAWSVDPDPYVIFGAAWKRERRFWVRAPGYAWTTVVGDFEKGGTLSVCLVPEAQLRVALSPRSRWQMGARQPLLEVGLSSGCGWKRLADGAAAFEFDGLPAGELTLRWRADDGTGGKQEVITERMVSVVAGHRTEIML